MSTDILDARDSAHQVFCLRGFHMQLSVYALESIQRRRTDVAENDARRSERHCREVFSPSEIALRLNGIAGYTPDRGTSLVLRIVQLQLAAGYSSIVHATDGARWNLAVIRLLRAHILFPSGLAIGLNIDSNRVEVYGAAPFDLWVVFCAAAHISTVTEPGISKIYCKFSAI